MSKATKVRIVLLWWSIQQSSGPRAAITRESDGTSWELKVTNVDDRYFQRETYIVEEMPVDSRSNNRSR